MRFDYFYGEQPKQFQFYKLPKILLLSEDLKEISMDAKVLYSLMLARAALSFENGWLDEAGRVYIYFTVDEICRVIKCANQKATKLLKELEGCGLICREKVGFNKPNRIYVMNFASEMWNSHVQRCENHDTGHVKIMIPESWKSHPNKTDINKTERNNTNLILSDQIRSDANGVICAEGLLHKEMYRTYFYDRLDVTSLLEAYPYEEERIEEIVELLTDICSGEAESILIGKTTRPGAVVRNRLMKLGYKHICYVLRSLDVNSTDVRNIRQYLLAVLYNAPVTINSYYQAKVNHDMSTGMLGKEGDEYA